MPSLKNRRLFVKYVASIIGIVSGALFLNTAVEAWFIHRSHQETLARLQADAAKGAAEKISRYLAEIHSQIAWTTHLPWIGDVLEQKQIDASRLLRQVPAITGLAYIDGQGRERMRVSRLAIDVENSDRDRSSETAFKEALANKVFFGPVYFQRDTEPHIAIAVAGASASSGVTIADVNLTHIWDVVSEIKVGKSGRAFVTDQTGRMIAHPDISIVLRNIGVDQYLHSADPVPGAGSLQPTVRKNLRGQDVLVMSAPVETARWSVLVEIPEAEAFGPLNQALVRTSLVFGGALIVAGGAGVFFARRISRPIQVLGAGAATIGLGNLGHRIALQTGDELEALANQINDMTAKLESSHATLEDQVRLRTSQLETIIQELRALRDVTAVVNSSLNRDTVLNSLVATAKQISDAQATAIYVLDDGSARFDLRATAGNQEFAKPEPGHEDLQKAVAERRAFIHDDAGRLQRLTIPLQAQGKLIGALVVVQQDAREFTSSTIDMVCSLAAQSGQALWNSHLFANLEAKSRELAQASRHKSQFLANTSHELRTPLHAIIGYTDLILEGMYGDLPDEFRGVLGRVRYNGKHLLGLIDDVLDLSKIEEGRITLNKSEFSFSDLVRNVCAVLEPLAAEKGLSLEADLPKDLPIAFGDERRMTQVLINLAGNAVKFTEVGRVSLRLRFDAGLFVVEVQDTGPGIPASEQSELFERFSQGKFAAGQGQKLIGAGLGLAISRQIALLHGGDLVLRSVYGEGATFTLTVPLRQQGA